MKNPTASMVVIGDEIDKDDIEEINELFYYAKASAKILEKEAMKYIS